MSHVVACTKAGPSPSLLNSVSHEIVLNVVTSASLHTVPNFPFRHSFHFIVCCVRPKPGTFKGAMCTLQMYPCQHVTKVSGIVNISRMADHAAQQHVPWECLCFRQLISTIKSSIPVHTLDLTIGPSTLSTAALHEIARLFSLQNKPTGPATNPYSHHAATEEVEEFNPFGAAASSNGTFATPTRFSEHFPCYSATWHKRHEHCIQRRQYERSHTGMDYVVSRRRRSRFKRCITFYL